LKVDAKDQMMDFFISYNKADRQWAEWIAWQLEAAGYLTIIQCWDFLPGCNFPLEMDNAIKKTKQTIGILSPDYFASPYGKAEWAAAFVDDPTGEKRKLLPIRVKECKPDGLLRDIKYIDLLDLEEEVAKRKLCDLKKTISAITPPDNTERKRLKPDTAPDFPGALSAPQSPGFTRGLPHIWNIPHHRNPNFTGRDTFLNNLKDALKSKAPGARIQAISGLGGIGKSSLAIEFAYKNASDYYLVWWVEADKHSTLLRDYIALAKALKLPEMNSPDHEAIAGAVKSSLEKNQAPWLLIYDNAEDPDSIERYLPKFGGHMIITSRNPNWKKFSNVLELGIFDYNEAVEFILNRTYKNDKIAAGELAKEMGCLPLALEQAGAYIEQTGISLSGYLELFRNNRDRLLRLVNVVGYPHTIATTWEISFQKLVEEYPVSIDLLSLLSFLSPENIPKSLIMKEKKVLPEPLASALEDEIGLNQTIAALRKYSLISVNDEHLSVHQLVQEVTRSRLGNDKNKWAEIALKMINSGFKFDIFNAETWQRCSLLLSHALTAIRRAEDLNVESTEIGHLLHKIGQYYKELADYARAKEILGKALITNRKQYGFSHPAVAKILNDIGSMMFDLRYQISAIMLTDASLAIAENTMGPDHPDIASILVNHGMAYRAINPLMAKADHKRALKIDKRNFGLVHPHVARDLKSLGVDMGSMGDVKRDITLSIIGMNIIKDRYGPDHHEYASFLNNIGISYEKMNELIKAKECLAEALAIDEKCYGPVHPKVAKRLNNLSNVLEKLGNKQEADECLHRALDIEKNNPSRTDENNRNDFNFETQRKYERFIYNNKEFLEITFKDMQEFYRRGSSSMTTRRFKDAINCFNKIIDLNKKQYIEIYAMGDDLVESNRFNEALSCYFDAATLLNLCSYALYFKGMSHFNLHQHEQAVDALEKAIEMEPNNSTFRVTLAGIYRKQGRMEEYRDQIAKSKEIIDGKIFNPGIYNLACFYAVSENKEEAIKKFEEAKELGQLSSEWAQIDPDLAELKRMEKFKTILK
jgi:tetratricopeptide (TPR) repeat protein